WRLSRRIARFDTLKLGRIVLHYDPKIRWDVSTLLPRIRAEIEELTERFGFRLRRGLTVYLFDDSGAVAATLCPLYRGTALSPALAVVISDDGDLRQMIRHELAHLFAARWSAHAPPLLAEGVAVWADGRNADATAFTCLGWKRLRPTALLSAHTF